MKTCTTPEERKEYRGQLKANEEKFDATVSSILSSEQKAKYDQMKQERHDRRSGMRHDQQPGK